jgi:tRNA (pseudouridine54-N1)-methyltransferase
MTLNLAWGESLERRFAIIGNRAASGGKLNLNDLPGCGRMDVIARAVNSALFISHGIRKDSQIVVHLMGGGVPRRVFFDGSELRGVRPDERSISGHFKSLMKTPVPPIGHFSDVSKGIRQSGGDIFQTLKEWDEEGVLSYLLDAGGESYEGMQLTGKCGFVLSDDLELKLEDTEIPVISLSLGETWLQGHSCISVMHHIMDSQIQ